MQQNTPKMRNTNQLNTGFTLIELLIVIAIIALLASILFPVFSRARENARRVSCQSNLKQIGLGIYQYSQDYDERTVPTQLYHDELSGTPLLQIWADLVYPYVKSQQVFNCPSNANGANYVYSEDRDVSGSTNYGSYNANGAHATNTSRPYSPMRDPRAYLPRISEINQPAETIMISDGWPTRSWLSWGAIGTSNGPAIFDTSTLKGRPRVLRRSDQASWGMIERHLETSNILYCDGHVKAMRLDKLTDLASSPKPNYLNPQQYMSAFTIEED